MLNEDKALLTCPHSTLTYSLLMAKEKFAATFGNEAHKLHHYARKPQIHPTLTVQWHGSQRLGTLFGLVPNQQPFKAPKRKIFWGLKWLLI